MYNFWESVLLHKASYKGNPMPIHISLDKKARMEQQHFDRWLQLWHQTLGELFEGPVATEASQKAESMAFLIHTKVLKGRD